MQEFIEYMKNSYGVYRLKNKWSRGYECAVLKTETEYNQLKTYATNESNNVEFCTIGRLIDGEIVTENIVGTEPDTNIF